MNHRSLCALARAQDMPNRNQKYFSPDYIYFCLGYFLVRKKKSKPNRKKIIFFRFRKKNPKKRFSKKVSTFSKKLIFFKNPFFFRSKISRFFKISNIFTFSRNFKIFKIKNLQDEKIFFIQIFFASKYASLLSKKRI